MVKLNTSAAEILKLCDGRRALGGTWAMLGEGVCDVPAVISAVRDAPNFIGWIVVEEESDHAGTDPAAAVRANRETLRRLGF